MCGLTRRLGVAGWTCLTFVVAVFCVALKLATMGNWQGSRYALSSNTRFYDLEAKDIYGKVRKMEEWKGQVLLVTNVASK